MILASLCTVLCSLPVAPGLCECHFITTSHKPFLCQFLHGYTLLKASKSVTSIRPRLASAPPDNLHAAFSVEDVTTPGAALADDSQEKDCQMQ